MKGNSNSFQGGPAKNAVDAGDKGLLHTLGTLPGQAARGVDFRRLTNAGKHWKSLNLLNGWSNAAGGKRLAEYCVDGLGFVHVRGRITGGTTTNGTVLADNVPAVALNELFTCAMGTTGGSIEISVNTAGQLAIAGTATGDISFAGMTYMP